MRVTRRQQERGQRLAIVGCNPTPDIRVLSPRRTHRYKEPEGLDDITSGLAPEHLSKSRLGHSKLLNEKHRCTPVLALGYFGGMRLHFLCRLKYNDRCPERRTAASGGCHAG